MEEKTAGIITQSFAKLNITREKAGCLGEVPVTFFSYGIAGANFALNLTACIVCLSYKTTLFTKNYHIFFA
ncbi:hypothetical protein A4G19_08955 [Pasteurellaceae bacterium Macca]|nr:hypothetical protein [Pasteurellaceae bacterium Macca]